MLLLFLLNLTGSIGPAGGYYFPSLESLNEWLQDTLAPKSKIQNNFTVGVSVRYHLGVSFALEAEADYFKAKSLDETRSLLLVPIDGYISYRHMILPIFLYTYLGVGYELCYVEYEDTEGVLPNKSGWGAGFPIKFTIEFIPTTNLGVELSAGHKFVKADIGFEDENKNSIPVDLWGGFFKVALKRVF